VPARTEGARSRRRRSWGVLSASLRELPLIARYAPESLNLKKEDDSWGDVLDLLFPGG
jgi:hypothetical protein